MKVAIAGAGNVGRFVARDLLRRGHEVVMIDKDSGAVARFSPEIAGAWIQADACEPLTLQGVGLESCEVMVTATGDDKVNLVASLLGKQEFGIPRVISRVNHPKNAWLFNESWGVDVAVSPPHLLTSLVEEAVTVGDLVTLLRLEHGKAHLVELTLGDESPAVGKVISELEIPRDCALLAIIRSEHVIVAREDTPLMVGDEVIALTSYDRKSELEELLSGKSGSSEETPEIG